MYKKDIPKGFDMTPRYSEILIGLDKSKTDPSEVNIVTKIPVISFKDLMKEYYLTDQDNMLFINQLMLDLGLAITLWR